MLRKPHRFRVFLFSIAFCLGAGVVGSRLVALQVQRHDHYVDRARRQQSSRVVVQAHRGDILDRTGRPLATSAGTLTVYADTRQFRAPHAEPDLDALAREAAPYANMAEEQFRSRLERDGVTALARQLEPENAHHISEVFDRHGLTSRAYWLHREGKRLYPRSVAPHLIGYCTTDGDGDNIGQAGLEVVYNDIVKGQRVETVTRRTGISQTLEPVGQEELLSAQGHTLVLTLDAAIQEAAEDALEKHCAKFNADTGGVLVQDVRTGAMLAMASWPTFDNAQPGASPAENLRNRLLTDPLETGSVVKLFTAAILLDTDLIRVTSPIDCEGGYAVVDGRRLRDSPGHYLDVVPFYEVIRHSSNIGVVKAAQPLDNQVWYDYLRAFGFGSKTGIDLPGEGVGLVYPPERWTKFSRSSLPMGYEIALTPIQIVNGLSALVNGGELLTPYVVAEVRDARGMVVQSAQPRVQARVIRPTTSQMLRYLMEDVVVNGTGDEAQVPGFRVGGKTGTTRKSHIHTHREYIASFGGALPIDDPKVAVYCYVDNPKGAYYAGEVAAPLFQEVARAVVLQLGLAPSETTPEEGSVPFGAEAPAASTKTKPLKLEDLPVPGSMPDLRGMTMAQVRTALPLMVQSVRFSGTGQVVDQVPSAGTPLTPEDDVLVIFAPPAAPYETAQATSERGG